MGALVYANGFSLSEGRYIIRELAFCDYTGHHHALFKFLLPEGMSFDGLSKEDKKAVDRQKGAVHSLPFEPFVSKHNTDKFRPYDQITQHIVQWCQQHLSTERDRLGVFAIDDLYLLLKEPPLSYPLVVLKLLEPLGCPPLRKLPISTVNVFAYNDNGHNWCRDHTHATRDGRMARLLCARTSLSDERLVTFRDQSPTHCLGDQRATRPVAKTMPSRVGRGAVRIL